MTQQKINILGFKWTIVRTNRNEEKRLENKDGFCDISTREIVVTKHEKDPEDIDQIGNVEYVNKKNYGMRSFMPFILITVYLGSVATHAFFHCFIPTADESLQNI